MLALLAHPLTALGTLTFSAVVIAAGESTANTAAVVLGSVAALISALTVAYGTYRKWHSKAEGSITLTPEELKDMLERRE